MIRQDFVLFGGREREKERNREEERERETEREREILIPIDHNYPINLLVWLY